MTIRFLCSACGQPIEIDDEWSSKPVACPYCRKTITAPAESQFDNLKDVPTATPLRNEPAEQPIVVSVPYGDSRSSIPAQTNRVAVAAVVLAVAVMVQFAVLMMIGAAHVSEFEHIESLAKARQDEGASPFEAQQQAMLQYLEDQGGVPPQWLMGMMMLYAGIAASWIAVVVCGIIGARRTYRRRMAVVALVFAGMLPVIVCCSGQSV